MKNSLFLYVATLLSLCTVSAQTPNTRNLKAGLSYVLFGSGDLSGLEYYNEYNHRLSPYVTLAPSLHVGYGAKSSPVYDADEIRFAKGSVAVDLNLYVSPMVFEKTKIRFGIGPSLRLVSDSHPNGYGIYTAAALNTKLPPNTPYVFEPFGYAKPLHYLTVGYTAVAEFELMVSARWLAGVRASFQGYARETVAAVGLNAGYRF